jgi:tetratricopeptide (TPR) repeat protein
LPDAARALAPDAVFDAAFGAYVLDTARPLSVLDVPAAEARRLLETSYRLKPDGRFLQAAAELHRLLTGQAQGRVAATFEDRHWIIDYAGQRVGALPELPDFGDARALLTAWAGCLSPAPRISLAPAGDSLRLRALERRAETADVRELGDLLRSLDSNWRAGRRDSAQPALAARALVSLVLVDPERLPLGDRLAGRALATLVFAEHLTGAKEERASALLADALGYGTAAESLVTALPSLDPVRLYVARDTARLRVIAEGDGGPVARYLYLLRLAERGDVTGFYDWREQHAPSLVTTLAGINAALALNQFETNPRLSLLILYQTLFELWQINPPLDLGDIARSLPSARTEIDLIRLFGAASERIGTNLPDALRRLEAELSQLEAGYDAGPFLDGTTFADLFRGYAYGAVYTLGLHVVDALGDAERADSLAVELRGAPAGVGAELARWYANVAAAESGRPNLRGLLRDMSSLRYLGAPAVSRTDEAIREVVGSSEPQYFEAAKLLVRRLDSRVSHRFDLASLASSSLVDPPMARKYYGAVLAAARARNPKTEVWLRYARGDRAPLLAMALDPGQTVGTRAYALGWLAGDSTVNPASVRAGFEAVMRGDPDRWDTCRRYVDYLERTRRYAEAIVAVQDWLRRHGPEEGFDYIAARTALARLHFALGRFGDAWDAVEPVVESWQAGAVGWGALSLEQIGKQAEALDLAQRLVARYPQSVSTRAVLSEILWHQGRYDEVLDVLAPRGYFVGTNDWRDPIGQGFARVFAERGQNEAVRAFDALAGTRANTASVANLPLALADAGRNDLAFALQSRLKMDTHVWSAIYPIRAYRYLRSVKGEAAAFEWLSAAIPQHSRTGASFAMYGDGEPQLLWSLIADPEAGESNAYTWMLRAAAAAEHPESINAVQRRQILQRFAGVRAMLTRGVRRFLGAEDRYEVLGRFLVGLESEEAVFRLMEEPGDRCEAAYYLGVKAAADGRQDDAIGWWRVAVETAQWQEGEYEWAYEKLRMAGGD